MDICLLRQLNAAGDAEGYQMGITTSKGVQPLTAFGNVARSMWMGEARHGRDPLIQQLNAQP